MLNRDLRAKINQAAHAAGLLHADELRRAWTAQLEAMQRAGAPLDQVQAELHRLTAPKPAGETDGLQNAGDVTPA